MRIRTISSAQALIAPNASGANVYNLSRPGTIGADTAAPLTCTTFTSSGIDDNAASNALTISAAKEVTMNSQPWVIALNSVTDTNVTGNGAVATVDFDTEIKDQNSDFATDTMTFPVDGAYAVSGAIVLQELDNTADLVDILLVCSNRSWRFLWSRTNLLEAATMTFPFAAKVDAETSDTMTVTVAVSGMGSDTVDIYGNAAPATFVTIYLLG